MEKQICTIFIFLEFYKDLADNSQQWIILCFEYQFLKYSKCKLYNVFAINF